MYLATNDVVKAVVTAVLLGQALAVPMSSVYNGEGAVLDARDVEVLDARDLDALEARDPRRGSGGLFKGIQFGVDLYDRLKGNNKRDVDETADEAAMYDEAADEESSGALAARDPRRGSGGLFKGFKFGVDLYDRLKGNDKRDLDMMLQARDLESIEARDLHMIDARDLAVVMARDPARGGLFKGFKYGLDLYSRLKGDNNNNKRDLDSALLARDLDTLEARDLEVLMARDPRGRGLFKGLQFGVDIYNRIKGNNNKRDLEVRDPRRGRGFLKGIQFGADIYDRVTGNNNNNNNKRDISDEAAEYEEAPEYEEAAELNTRDLHMMMARDLHTLMTRDPRRGGGFLKGIQFGADIYNRIKGNNNKRDLSDESAAYEEAAELYARNLHTLMARDPRRGGGFLKGLQFGADIYNRITGNNNNKRDITDEAAVYEEAPEYEEAAEETAEEVY